MTVEAVCDSGTIETVYNCRVAEYHTYFVGSADWQWSVWAHNACNGPQADPKRPAYNNGATHQDHARARALGGTDHPSNIRPLPAETNLRKGGHEGQLVRDWQRYREAGMTDAQIEQVLGPEIQSMATSPPPRPMDPRVLDGMPGGH